MNVPFADLGREARAFEHELTEAAERVIRSGHYLYGAELEAFEHEIAGWHGVKYAVGVACGTDAVELGLRAAWGPGPVWCPAFAPPPCVNAIEAAGCEPVLMDADPVTRMSMGGGRMFVHMFGLAGDPGPIGAVEDCAHSMGATIGGRLAGTMGACGAISFYPSKTLGALGDGGVVITNDAKVAATLRELRHYGFNEERTNIALRGQNSRLSEIQAAMLRVKLPHVHGWINRRREIAARYNAELSGRVRVPVEPEGSRGVFHVYVVEAEDRDRLASALNARGISTMRHYPKAIHQFRRWRHLGGPGAFPVAERLAATALSLPCYPFLSDAEQDAVIEAVKAET